MGQHKELLIESFSQYHLRVYKAKRNVAIAVWILFLTLLVIFFLK